MSVSGRWTLMASLGVGLGEEPGLSIHSSLWVTHGNSLHSYCFLSEKADGVILRKDMA